MLNVETLYEEGYFTALEHRFAESLARIVPGTSPEVLLAAALTLQQTQAGHVCVAPARFAGRPILSREGNRIGDFKWPSLKKWLKEIAASPLTSDGETGAPLVLDAAGRLYLHRYWRYETELAAMLAVWASAPPEALDDVMLEDGLDRLFGPADPSNVGTMAARLAAERACRRKLAVITGGPGTGKTTLVLRILTLLAEQQLSRNGVGPAIVVAAPTGKAADRIGEVMGRMSADVSTDPRVVEVLPKQAMTVHRLLGSGKNGTMPSQAISADIVVVDEASMVDVALMHALVSALRPSARLILLGDKDQLSSVESGAVLADICDAAIADEKGPMADITSTLTFSYRFDGQGGIGRLSDAINRGDVAEALQTLHTDPSKKVRFVSALTIEEIESALTPLIACYYGEALAETDPDAALARFMRFRILTAHRRGPMGSAGINRFVETELYKAGHIDLGGMWYRGRPVMVTRNDYHLGLFNGDIGLALPAGKESAYLSVFFSGIDGLLQVLPARLAAAETAYAMTVHRSQGSEFDHVAVVLPSKPSPIITRELLYTACTRAKKSLTIIGPESQIRHAVENPTQRVSGLKDCFLTL